MVGVAPQPEHPAPSRVHQAIPKNRNGVQRRTGPIQVRVARQEKDPSSPRQVPGRVLPGAGHQHVSRGGERGGSRIDPEIPFVAERCAFDLDLQHTRLRRGHVLQPHAHPAQQNVLADGQRDGGKHSLRDGLVGRASNLPGHGGVGERRGAKMRGLDLRLQRVRRGQNPMPQTGQRNRCVAEMAEFLRRRITFFLPKSVQQPDQRRALVRCNRAGREVQNHQGPACAGWLRSPPCSRPIENAPRPRQTARPAPAIRAPPASRGKSVVARLHHAGEFRDDRVIRVGAPLPQFMREHRHIHPGERLRIIAAEPRPFAPHRRSGPSSPPSGSARSTGRGYQ